MEQAIDLWNNLDTTSKVASVVATAAPVLYFLRKVCN